MFLLAMPFLAPLLPPEVAGKEVSPPALLLRPPWSVMAP